MNQQSILNKVSLSRNTHKTRLCIDWLMKMSWPEAPRNLTLFPLGAMVCYSLIQRSQLLYTTTVDDENWLYVNIYICTYEIYSIFSKQARGVGQGKTVSVETSVSQETESSHDGWEWNVRHGSCSGCGGADSQAQLDEDLLFILWAFITCQGGRQCRGDLGT